MKSSLDEEPVIVEDEIIEDDLELGPLADDVGHRRQVDRGILADRGMRTAAGFDPAHPIGGQHLRARQRLGVLARIDVVGDDADLATGIDEQWHECLDQRGLAGADGAADADAQRGSGAGHGIGGGGSRGGHGGPF